MTPEEFSRICEWDARCTVPEEAMFGTAIDRRRLIERVKELEARLRETPFAIDDDRTILIYGIRYAMSVFKHLGLGPINSVVKIVARTDDGRISLQRIYNYDELTRLLTFAVQHYGLVLSDGFVANARSTLGLPSLKDGD